MSYEYPEGLVPLCASGYYFVRDQCVRPKVPRFK